MTAKQTGKTRDTTQQIDADLVVCSLDVSGMDAENNEHVIQLIPVDANGRVAGVDGRSWLLDAESILANAVKSKTDFPIDYNHASLDARKTGAAAPAAGWVDRTSLESRPDGIYGRVSWNTPAAAHLGNREFRYTSPVFTFSPNTGKTIAYKGSGLTHYPNLGELKPVVNSTGIEENDNMEDLIEDMRRFLHLPRAANEQDITNELNKVIAQISVMAANDSLGDDATLIDLVASTEARIKRLSAAVAANSQGVDATAFVPRVEFDRVSAQLQKLTDTSENARVEQAVNTALEAGKITPASLDWARAYCRKDADGFAAFASNAQKVIPFGEDAANTNIDGSSPALTTEEVAVCTQMGLSTEDYIKTKKSEVK